MSFNLLDSVKGLFSSDVINKMASSFGESEGGIQKAIGGAIPAVLTGLLNKASSADGAASLLNLSKDAASSGMLGNLGNLLGGGGNLLGKGMDMLKGLFGDKTNAITSMIASYSGIRESSASSLLSVAAPAALGTVGKQVTQNNMGVSGLTSWLAQQKDSILSAVPSGLNIAGALGLGSLSDLGNKLSGLLGTASGSVKHVAGTASAYAHETTEKAKGGAKWLWPLLLALLVILALIYFLRGKGKKTDDIAPAPTEQTTPATDTTATVNTTPTLESIKVRLPDGTELDAYRGGIEDRLVAFLNDPNSKGGKDVWFDFDNLNFKTGSAEITDESMVQVNNIAAILKAYPDLVIKIGGYTDKSGDEKVNMKLSQDRANAVSNSLKGKGANNKQIAGAEGYGSQFAKAAADAPDEERKKDRRIAVGVREK
jgi:outer membrane protein OmpA-like peptidoglycan-associated protein